MIGRVMLLAAGAVAAAGAVLFGRRKARQQTRARRRAERQAKRARATSASSVAAAAFESVPAPKVADAPATAEAALIDHERSDRGAAAAPAEQLGPAFTSIKGIGPAMEARLRAAGVTSVAQIAGWSDVDVEAVAPRLKVTPERIRRDGWVEQARAVVGGAPAAA